MSNYPFLEMDLFKINLFHNWSLKILKNKYKKVEKKPEMFIPKKSRTKSLRQIRIKIKVFGFKGETFSVSNSSFELYLVRYLRTLN